MTAKVCKPLWKLKSVMTEWSWNGMYQTLCDKAKNIIKQDTCMKFYNVSKPLYLDTDASGICLGVGLLQVRGGMNCRWDEVPDQKTQHCAPVHLQAIAYPVWIGSIALGILHGMEKFHFAKGSKFYHINQTIKSNGHKDVATLTQQLQCIMLCLHQYSMCILYKPGPDLYMVNWLSHQNHTENRDQEIAGMNVSIHTLAQQ